MQHLTTDRLAALADEPPTPDEVTHLAHCLACRREREVYVALLELARREGSAGVEPGALAEVGQPLTAWESLAPALRSERLIDDTLAGAGAGGGTARRTRAAAEGRPTVVRRVAPGWWRRAAAAGLLLAVGAAGGRASAGGGGFALGLAAEAAADVGESVAPRLNGLGEAVAEVTPAFDGVSDAAAALARAQRDYQRAAAYLAEHDTSAFVGGSEALRTRLAALDEVMPRVAEALADAPLDPVLNQYYNTTYDARETTLRQLGRTLPAGTRLSGY
jgi:hypothetical protein